MRYHRAVFAAGVAVGFIAGSRAGRERYDQIVKYTRKAIQSPPARRATHAVSGKATELSKSAAAKATVLTKSAASRAPKAAGSVARKARDKAKDTKDSVAQAGGPKVRAPKLKVPKVSVTRHGTRFGSAHPYPHGGTPTATNAASQAWVNGSAANQHGTTHNGD
jgi:hypothetical protein